MVRYPELPTVLVNAPHWTPRLEAALEWTFTSVLGLGWERMDKAAFEASGAPWKLSYGGPSGGPGCWIEPEGLLDGTELRFRDGNPLAGEDYGSAGFISVVPEPGSTALLGLGLAALLLRRRR